MHDGRERQPIVERISDAADTWRRSDGGVSRTIVIPPSWLSWGKTHTGYLAGLGLQTMSAAVGAPWVPRSLSTAFLRSVADELPLTLTATVERVGSSSSVASLRAVQAGASVLVSTATFGASSAPPPYASPALPTVPPYASPAMPTVPPPDSCPALPHALAPFTQHLEMRAATDDRCLGAGARAELTSWMRFADGRAIDAPGLAILLDGHAPSLYATFAAPVRMPLRQYVVEFGDELDRLPSVPWTLVRVRLAHAGGGWVIDETRAWSEGGRFLAGARQHRELVTREPETK